MRTQKSQGSRMITKSDAGYTELEYDAEHTRLFILQGNTKGA